MSYLSTSENVGFSGIPQNISDTSCATQYKMAVDSVPASCSGEVNIFIHDSSGDEQAYLPHLNDNFFHTKFKIDPNELYTFHDSDVIAGEITVSHTEDNFVFPENVDVKCKLLDSPNKDLDLIGSLTNGEIKEEIKEEVVLNGHYPVDSHSLISNIKDVKTSNTKVQKAKIQNLIKDQNRSNVVNDVRRPSVHSPKAQCSNVTTPSSSSKASISSFNGNQDNATPTTKLSVSETFLDVFKREQGVDENQPATAKSENSSLPKVITAVPKRASTAKSSAQTKPRRGRGPAVHEALQRISTQHRAIALPNLSWHAPGEDLFECGPLDSRRPNPFKQLESSSSDDDNMPDFESGSGPVCVEESAAESRGARLALRRAALRRQVARADTALRLSKGYREQRSLNALIKKQVRGQGPSCRLPAQTVNHLLAMRGMPTVLTSQERRKLRESGWSGGESGALDATNSTCVEDGCVQPPMPCGRHCLEHVTLASDQRLYAACAAVYAGGARCKQPLLLLQDQTPLCAEHATS